MVKNVLCLALGGHICNQNASFRRLIDILEPKEYKFFGGKDGFKCFETRTAYELEVNNIPKDFAGFVAGSGRYSLKDKQGNIDPEKMQKARDFIKKGKFDAIVGSGGDDHSMQMHILSKELGNLADFYVINKTMDNDLGGKKAYTDFTNGFHSAVSHGVEMIHQHYSGAWTNDLPYLVGHFGRESNWVGIALTYWGLADKFIYGELPENHPGHSIEKIYETIINAQDKNEKEFGRRFAMVVVPEGTRISGFEHASKDLVDEHGHHKLQPELLVSQLKTELQKKYNLKTQTLGITYEMRNFRPTMRDNGFGELSAIMISGEIKDGNSGTETVFKIQDNKIYGGTDKIENVAQKRFANDYDKPLIDKENFEVTDEIGKYYHALFGNRKKRQDILPKKLKSISFD
ncbi:hypothetical protein GOV14_01615 [Candidatus Pacearchaeota archaeon]|nr:hypothetical protein [Candidatus Pacearchaeota archaeon]